MGSGILLIGYDVESFPRSEKTVKFLEMIPKIHEEYKAPCSFFIVGRTLLAHLNEFRKVYEKYNSLIDFEQHTFSHKVFKNLVIEYRNYMFKEGASLDEIKTEVRVTSEIMEILLGIRPMGLTTPWGHYRGLMDRPDILRALWDLGIRFIRSWARNEKDSLPVSLDIQPFWYDSINKIYPPILECTVQGWHDNALKERLKSREEYIKYVKDNIDYVSEKNLIWSYVQHDHSSFWKDPNLEIVRIMIEYALDKDVKIISYKQFYEMKLSERLRYMT